MGIDDGSHSKRTALLNFIANLPADWSNLSDFYDQLSQTKDDDSRSRGVEGEFHGGDQRSKKSDENSNEKLPQEWTPPSASSFKTVFSGQKKKKDEDQKQDKGKKKDKGKQKEGSSS